MILLHFTQAQTHSYVNFTLTEYLTVFTQAVCFSVLVSVYVYVLERLDAFEASCRRQYTGSNLLFLCLFFIYYVSFSGLKVVLK